MERRILWLTENYPPQRGGMAQSCDRIVDQLRKCGNIIDVLHFAHTGTPFRQTHQINGSCTSFPYDETESHTLNRTWEFIKEQPVDAIVCFGGYLPMLAAPVYCKWLGVPLVTLIRGNDFDNAIFTPRKRDVLRDALEASNRICAVSRDKVEKIKGWLPHVKVQFIPNGIDCSQWMPTKSEMDFAHQWKNQHCQGKFCVGLFGQLKKKKGVQFLMDALQQSALLPRLHFLLIGDIAEQVHESLTANDISYSHFPFMDRYELLKYYLCSDAIAIPSFYDGMPNVLLEAGALGIPVIAADVDGMRDVISHQQNGLLFKVGDAASCRQSFYELEGLSPEARVQLGLALKTTISTSYSSAHETQLYDTLFKELLDTDHRALRLHAQ